MTTEIREFINSIKMSNPGCINKTDCAHYYKELRLNNRIIKGEFCIRFEDWPKDLIATICNGEEMVLNYFINRKYTCHPYSFITKKREFVSGVLNLNKIFCID